MIRQRRKTLTGLGVGLAAAAATAAVGVVADRLVRARQTAKALDSSDTYDEPATSEVVVIASDGVQLHVEIDEPEGQPAVAPSSVPVPTVVFCHGYTLSPAQLGIPATSAQGGRLPCGALGPSRPWSVR